MDLGHFLLDLAQIVDPLIALLMCAIWNDAIHLSRFRARIAQWVLALVLVLSLLIPVALIGQGR